MMIPKFIRKQFHGVQVPLGKWIVRHVFELIILSPAILATWLYLKLRKYEVIITGVNSPAISIFLAPLEPELRKRIGTKTGLKNIIVLNLSLDANSLIRKMYNEIVLIYGAESPLRRRLIWWATKLGVNASVPDQVLSDSSWSTRNPSVEISRDEENRGYAYLDSVGIGRNTSFICYATRSESYYSKLIDSGVIAKPRSIRNPDENTYITVAQKISNRGLPVIRMGKDLNTTVTSAGDGIFIDYAATARTDELDCFLLSKCKFLLVGSSGIIWFRRLFNLPSLCCDVYDIRNTQTLKDIYLFQRVRHTSSGDFATISEMIEMRSDYADERHQGRLGVELVKKTSDEILDACEEMEKRIDGTWTTTADDDDLQKQFSDLILRYSDLPAWHGGGKVGTEFLRSNRDLIR